jgi:hypothetical protein
MTPAAPVAKFASGVIDTGSKFATGVIDAREGLQISIFKKIRINPNVIFRGLGEDDSGKKPEAKNLVTQSL